MIVKILDFTGGKGLFEIDNEQKTAARLLFDRSKYNPYDTHFYISNSLVELIGRHNLLVDEQTYRLSDYHEHYPKFSEAEYLARSLAHNKNLIPGCQLPLRCNANVEQYTYSCLYHDERIKIFLFHDGSASNLKLLFQSTTNDFHVKYLIDALESESLWIDEVLSQIKELPDMLTLYGFGLGGLMAQLFMIRLVELKTPAQQKLNLVTINSPGLNEEWLGRAEQLNTTSLSTFHQMQPNNTYCQWGGGYVVGDVNIYLTMQQIPEKSKNRQLYFTRPFADGTISEYQPVEGLAHTARALSYVRKSVEENDNSDVDYFEIVNGYRSSAPLGTREAQFAHGEYLFLDLAYRHFKNGAQVPVFNKDFKVNTHAVTRIVHSRGLYVYLLRPLDNETHGATQDWKILFQGTDFSEKNSAVRDLEPGSAGHKSLTHKRYVLLSRINHALSSEKVTKVRLTIGGHSLGGADTQNFFTSFLLALTKLHQQSAPMVNLPTNIGQSDQLYRALALNTPTTEHFGKISQVDMMSFNGAGVRSSTQLLSMALLKQLTQSPLMICVFFQHVVGDIVQMVGEGAVATSAANKEAEVCVHKVYDPDLLHVHTNFQFWKKTLETRHYSELIDNENHSDAVNNLLTFKIQPKEIREVSRGLTEVIHGPGGCFS